MVSLGLFVLGVGTSFAQGPSLTVQVKVITGAPFSAVAVTQSAQTLTDGNQISRTTAANIARDSDGRTRREQIQPNGASIVFLEDPVAGYGYVIDPVKKAVRRFAVANADHNSAAIAGSTSSTGTSLGSQVIEGLQVEGTRLVHTFNAGDAGNERAFDVTIEAWYSNDLQTVLLRKTSDPRSGETVYKLTNIQRSEPEATLFQIPSGYSMQDDVIARK